MNLYSFRVQSSAGETLVSSYVHPNPFRVRRKAAAAAATLSGDVLLVEIQAVSVNRLGVYRVTTNHYRYYANDIRSAAPAVIRMHDELMTLDAQYDPEWMPPFRAMLSGIFSRAYRDAYAIPDAPQLIDAVRTIENARYCYNHPEEV